MIESNSPKFPSPKAVPKRIDTQKKLTQYAKIQELEEDVEEHLPCDITSDSDDQEMT
jgi:hypothetical protein